MMFWEKDEPKINNELDGSSDADYAELNHGLPKKFLNALKALFDILDETKTGFIKMADIEHRWKEEECNSNVPKKLLEFLNNVQTANGLINFERFCAGIKLCLLANQCDNQLKEFKNGNNNYKVPKAMSETDNHRPMVNSDNHQMSKLLTNDKQLETNSIVANVQPQSVIETNLEKQKFDERVKSFPQLKEPINHIYSNTNIKHFNSDQKIIEEPNIPRLPLRSKIINILKDWRNNVIQKNTTVNSNNNLKLKQETGKPAHNIEPTNLQFTDEQLVKVQKVPIKRREIRRHTVSHAIDVNTIKRMKQYEQEKEILLQGLEMVDRARDWYIKNVNTIQGKLRFLGQTPTPMGDHSLDTYQERINFQTTRILTVNQHLAALMDSEKRFPLHMNLALRPLTYESNHSRLYEKMENINNVTIQRLKEQNRLLTEEVSRKSDKITKLEREKSALIRELFQARSNNGQELKDNDENTFM